MWSGKVWQGTKGVGSVKRCGQCEDVQVECEWRRSKRLWPVKATLQVVDLHTCSPGCASETAGENGWEGLRERRSADKPGKESVDKLETRLIGLCKDHDAVLTQWTLRGRAQWTLRGTDEMRTLASSLGFSLAHHTS